MPQYFFTDDGRVFANAAGEHQRVNALQRNHVFGNVFGQTIAEHVQCQLCCGIAFVRRFGQLATVVGQLGNTEQAGFFVHQIQYRFGRNVQTLHHIGDDGRINVTGARAHDQTRQWCETHRGVHAFTAYYGGNARTIAQVGADDVQVGLWFAEQFSGFLRDVAVAGAVETVATHVVVAFP